MRAYYRNSDGTLEIGSVMKIDGDFFTVTGSQLFKTGEKENLVGWPDEGEAEWFSTRQDKTRVVLIPVK